MKSSKSKNKMQPNSSKNSNGLEIIADCESSASISTVKKRSNTTVDKDVTASSSSIDLFNILNASEDIPDQSKENVSVDKVESQTKRARQLTRDRTPLKRDKYPRQHRIKVRSPKRRTPILDTPNSTQPKSNDINKCAVGTEAIDWDKEVEICVDNSANVVETTEDEERQSDHSLDDMCRICHGGDGLSPELGPLISACSCRGTVGRVHVKCLERWLTESGKSRCELCGTRYATRRVHRYGVPRALVMWILSQNAKQVCIIFLLFVTLGITAVIWLIVKESTSKLRKHILKHILNKLMHTTRDVGFLYSIFNNHFG